MSREVIVIAAPVGITGLAGALSTTQAMEEAINLCLSKERIASAASISYEVIAADELDHTTKLQGQEITYCPLTLDIPNTLQFWGQNIFQACQNLTSIRQQIQQFGYKTGDIQGSKSFYLPIVLTAKGPLYGEVIGTEASNVYQQPIDLPDNQRQPLYYLAYQLLQALAAPPSVYLLKFGYDGEIIGDRLLPFPDLPALASIGVQEPNLFICYWHCLTNQPIYDLTIIPKSA
jgi:hypothetical protein